MPIKSKTDTTKPNKSGCTKEILVIIMASALLGIYVGAETGFGTYVVVYSKWNNDFTEANG